MPLNDDERELGLRWLWIFGIDPRLLARGEPATIERWKQLRKYLRGFDKSRRTSR